MKGYWTRLPRDAVLGKLSNHTVFVKRMVGDKEVLVEIGSEVYALPIDRLSAGDRQRLERRKRAA